MDYEALEQELKKIVAVAEKQPEQYRVKCFEVMLGMAVAQQSLGGNP